MSDHDQVIFWIVRPTCSRRHCKSTMTGIQNIRKDVLSLVISSYLMTWWHRLLLLDWWLVNYSNTYIHCMYAMDYAYELWAIRRYVESEWIWGGEWTWDIRLVSGYEAGQWIWGWWMGEWWVYMRLVSGECIWYRYNIRGYGWNHLNLTRTSIQISQLLEWVRPCK